MRQLAGLAGGSDSVASSPAAAADAAMDLLCEEGYDPMFGARPLKRAIQRLIQNPLSKKILRGCYQPGSKIIVDTVDKQLVIN